MANISKTFMANNNRGNFKKENVRFTVSHADGTFVPPTRLAAVVDFQQTAEIQLMLPDKPILNIQFYWEELVAFNTRVYRYQIVEGDSVSPWNVAAIQWNTTILMENGKKTVYDGSWGAYGEEAKIKTGMARRTREEVATAPA